MVKKRLFSLVFSMIALISIVPFCAFPASAETEGYLSYTISNGEATITDCSAAITGALVIPDVLGGASVTAIAEGAFSYCPGLTSIAFGPYITSVGDAAFLGCTGLKGVYIQDLSSWCEVDFGYSTSNPLFYAEKLYLNNTLITELVIPNDVTEISCSTFWGCTALTSVSIPDNVTTIGDSAFYDCKMLKEIAIGDGVIAISDHAFYGCSALASVTIPDNVATIGYRTFSCSGLNNIILGNGVTTIGSYAFEGCSDLSCVILGKKISSIDYSAFKNSSVSVVWCGRKADDKDQIRISSENDTLKNAEWHFMFNDVSDSHWAFNSIFYCYRNGIMSGVGDGTNFNPSGTMTRAALVSMLYRLEGSPAVSGNAGFSDVAEGAWYADAVAWASQNGIVSGKGDGRFAPTDPVTRMSFVSILYRYAEYRGDDVTARADLSGFADADSIPAWARANIEWAVAEGLLSGVTSGNSVLVNYGGKATRAQGAVLLQKFCEME